MEKLAETHKNNEERLLTAIVNHKSKNPAALEG